MAAKYPSARDPFLVLRVDFWDIITIQYIFREVIDGVSDFSFNRSLIAHNPKKLEHIMEYTPKISKYCKLGKETYDSSA